MAEESKKNFKVWIATKESEAGFMVTPKSAVMAGNDKNTVIAHETGVYIGGGGPVSFNTTAENIRMGGMFTQMNDMVRMIPPTALTPFPPQIPFPPLAMPSAVTSELTFFMALTLL